MTAEEVRNWISGGTLLVSLVSGGWSWFSSRRSRIAQQALTKEQLRLQQEMTRLASVMAAGPKAKLDEDRAADVVFHARLEQLRMLAQFDEEGLFGMMGPAKTERKGIARRAILEGPVTVEPRAGDDEGVRRALQMHPEVTRVVCGKGDGAPWLVTLTVMERLVYFPPPPPTEGDVETRGPSKAWAAAIASIPVGGHRAIEKLEEESSPTRAEWFQMEDDEIARSRGLTALAQARVLRAENRERYLAALARFVPE